MSLLDKLNDPQRAAVEYGDGPLLVLAGAGSGKTRVLTHRIAHLIAERGVDPQAIFAVTFTNKAAAEMRERVQAILSGALSLRFHESDLWVSTFHSACVRILRTEIHHLGYNNQFTIYDDSDQKSVIKACLKELGFTDSTYSPKAIQARINKVKNEGLDHTTYQSTWSGPQEDAFVQVFARYAEALKLSSALDFADLILLTVKLFQEHPRVLAAYQNRFEYLLIDEYQDTNRCQYMLMKLLAGQRANICAVGDEDQSIYRWRGADISNILNFEQDYPNTAIFKLEQNYRSTKTIIEAASHIINHNTERREKTLWTENADGDLIKLFECYDEHDEALKVVNEVANSVSGGCPLSQVAVFYRTNAQSRLIEDRLRSQGVNYEIYGGLKFYARLEIKDALAYLRLLVNPDDDVSFRRIVNVPARGIGAVSLKKVADASAELGISHYQLLKRIFDPELGPVDVNLGRAHTKFEKFYTLIEDLVQTRHELLPSDLLNYLLDESGYREGLKRENTTEAQSRLENLAELRQSIVEYELRQGTEEGENTEESKITLEGFLEEVALVTDIDRFDPNAPAMKMMTIHMAKGLEFDQVMLVGLEEELFPNIRTWDGEEPEDIEEERRLFYVGMTRARKNLSLFYAKNRTVFGSAQFRVASRFLEELPEEYLENKKADFFTRRRHYLDRPGLPGRGRPDFDEFSQITEYDDDFASDIDQEDEFASLQAGSRVEHPQFGRGVIRKMLDRDKAMVEFRGQGLKKISLKYGLLKGVY